MANQPSKLKTLWFQDLPSSQQDQFKQSVLGSKIVLDKLGKIVYNMCISGEKVSIDQYDTASWSHRQAHQNGRNEALREILELITINGDH
jgi:hypothetical protein